MNDLALLLSFTFVIIALVLSAKTHLTMEKDMLTGSIRAVLQLVVVGSILSYVFDINTPWVTTVLLLLMTYNAAKVAAKRGDGIPHIFRIAYGALLAGLVTTLAGLLVFGTISYRPSEVIPISGMIAGNSMVALGILFQKLKYGFIQHRDEVEVKLSLGVSAREAADIIIKDSLRTALQPTVDSMKTLGIVQLPGMMTGLILAGLSPAVAIKYQIMVAFMLVGAVAVSSFLAAAAAYKQFFNSFVQLVSPLE